MSHKRTPFCYDMPSFGATSNEVEAKDCTMFLDCVSQLSFPSVSPPAAALSSEREGSAVAGGAPHADEDADAFQELVLAAVEPHP